MIGVDYSMDIQPVEKNIRLYTIQLFGTPKIGKTTFSINDRTFLLDMENGSKLVKTRKRVISSWIDFKTCIQWLFSLENAPIDTVCVDGTDAMVRMAMDFVHKNKQIAHISDLAHSKGYKILQDEVLSILLYMMNNPKYALWLVGHVKCTTKRTASGDREFFESTIMNSVANLINMYVDLTMFAGFNDKNERILYCQSSPYHDAGGRIKLPAMIEFKREVFDVEFKKAIDLIEEQNL